MNTVRGTLQRLGWPVDEMSDKQVASELYRRWFACQRQDIDEEGPMNVASAKGIFVSMACDGNLDALCWSENDVIPEEEMEGIVSEDDEAFFMRGESPEAFSGPDRRRSPRESTRDLVRWHTPDGNSDEATGWLVESSAKGIAFIAQADHAPIAGAEIIPSILSRTEGVIMPGPAIVVRTEVLNAELVLVCAQIEEESLGWE